MAGSMRAEVMHTSEASAQADRNSEIRDVRATILRVPTIRAHALSSTVMLDQRMVLVEIETRDGAVGIGEAATINGLSYSEESPDSIALTVRRYLAPQVLGRDAGDPAGIAAHLGKTTVGNHFSKMAVETALWDLLGKRTGRSVGDVLGTPRTDRLSCVWTLASGDTQADIEEGRRMIAARRHRDFKLKIGRRHWREDVAHCKAIREAFPDSSIRVDVNQGWSEDTALAALPALHEIGVEMVEQPLPVHAREASLRLSELPQRPAIVLDEALRGGPHALWGWTDRVDGVSLKIAQAGGLGNCRELAGRARAAGLSLYGGTMLEGPVATVASAHLFATLPDMRWGTELFGPRLLAGSLLREPLRYEDFHLIVPTGPGLGVELDPDAVRDAARAERVHPSSN